MNKTEIAKQFKKYLDDNDLTQQAVANATNIDQSYISRIRNGRFKRVTEKVKKVCDYASIDLNLHKNEINPAENSCLMEAISEVWDGTNEKAKALAKVIRSLKDLS